MIKDQIDPVSFPSLFKYGFGNCTEYKYGENKHPKDLSPTAVVHLSVGGEHSVIAAQNAIFAGGNFGGCSGMTAAQTVVNWINSKISDAHLWFPPTAIYNHGCFDYTKPSTVSEHNKKRLIGATVSLQSCLNNLQITSDERIAAYLEGYLKLWLIPTMTDKNWSRTKTLSGVSMLTYKFKFYNGYKYVGEMGEGTQVFHLHLGMP